MLNTLMNEKKQGAIITKKVTDREKIVFFLKQFCDDVREFKTYIQVARRKFYFTEYGNLRSIVDDDVQSFDTGERV